jgi:hypothetical protein
LKASREKCQVTYTGKVIRETEDFSVQTLKARKAWNDVLQAIKENNFQHRLLYPSMLAFITEEEINTFHDKQKIKEFMTTKPAL